ncbi:hypothetical protein HIM_11682 [Hirsutella minnesotensis 3608]|uniref:Uncharacterized protein n=1 Tax=Hirsutella minnesotensis 3608 TaxID=1043627 RepID=A0A0F7ZR36_9HYPO|nr:hypothetical protein HIM_11682 [Hirsutella minnesotensis 3608]
MDARAAHPQPNFETISDSFDALSEQFSLCSNLPAVDGGARLVDMLQAVLNRLDTLDRKVDGIDRKVDGLERRMTVAERNGVARMENSSAMRSDAALAPLFSLETGAEIPGCPSTMEEAGELSSRETASFVIDSRRGHAGGVIQCSFDT